MKREINFTIVVMLAALFMAVFVNFAFFKALLGALGPSEPHWVRVGMTAVILYCFLLFMLAVLCSRKTLKPVLIALFTVSAVTSYFMDSFGVIIDPDMLVNVSATDSGEVRDLLTGRFPVYVVFLAVIPSWLLLRVRIKTDSFGRSLRSRAGMAGGSILVAMAVLASASGFYATLIREHKPVRYYTNPLTPLYSAYRYSTGLLASEAGPESLHTIGEDAHIPPGDKGRELIVMVVGETVRADHFSLNGYSRQTNPRLSELNVTSFANVSSCGTSTAISVPCMFSVEKRDEFDRRHFNRSENLLDVLNHAGVNILWRDNNSDSKGVAERFQVEDFKSPDVNPVCDVECRDVGMLEGLQEYVDSLPAGDILIVLHQMGSHGPAYFKRYPPEFRKFTPTCDTNQLDLCSVEEVVNSYDNSILYTDYFLSRVVSFLENNDDRFETAMMYISDHGESLGEHGLFLHSAPYVLAPMSQKQVPLILWFGGNFESVDASKVRFLAHEPVSHDDVFHTVLGMFEVSTDVYSPELDLLYRSRNPAGRLN